jgi:hypothetical protein
VLKKMATRPGVRCEFGRLRRKVKHVRREGGLPSISHSSTRALALALRQTHTPCLQLSYARPGGIRNFGHPGEIAAVDVFFPCSKRQSPSYRGPFGVTALVQYLPQLKGHLLHSITSSSLALASFFSVLCLPRSFPPIHLPLEDCTW